MEHPRDLAVGKLQVRGPSPLPSPTSVDPLQISQCKVTTIPDGVFYLGRLSYLRLFGNQLTALPAYWSMVYLIELDVGNNNLTALPDGVCSCLQLRVLKVRRQGDCKRVHQTHLGTWLAAYVSSPIPMHLHAAAREVEMCAVVTASGATKPFGVTSR